MPESNKSFVGSLLSKRRVFLSSIVTVMLCLSTMVAMYFQIQDESTGFAYRTGVVATVVGLLLCLRVIISCLRMNDDRRYLMYAIDFVVINEVIMQITVLNNDANWPVQLLLPLLFLSVILGTFILTHTPNCDVIGVPIIEKAIGATVENTPMHSAGVSGVSSVSPASSVQESSTQQSTPAAPALFESQH